MMKKLLIAAFAAISAFSAQAANGDTTWVQAHADKWLDHYGAHDTTVQFPDGTKSYRRVYMIWTLGKYQCPGSPQYCGDWDYTVNTYLMTKTGDTVELGRYITPYANAGSPRTPWTWRQRYVFDVTDYYTLLKDSATVRINYSGYSWGFTGNVKFAFVEGTPARNVLGISKLWDGYYNFGGATPIDNYVTQKSLTAPANTQFAELKFIVSGHGADQNYCSEFCKKYYQVKLNGSQIEQKDIWRDNCGKNHLYPQSGTWVYDRGNWCPGDIVFTNTHKLAGVTGGNNFDVDVDFESYNSPNGGAGYGVSGNVVYYGAYNRAKDASLEDIIAPSNHETHFRENPCGGKPIIEVMNTGSGAITSMKIEYGVDGGATYTYNWTGTLNAMEKTKITLNELGDLRKVTGANNSFTAKILEVNGGADEDASNNQLKSYFSAAPQWPMAFRVTFKANNVPETRWKIYDGLNNIIAQRDGTTPNASYTDTVRLGPGSYKFVVEDDGCDGLNWWANSAAGAGNIQVRGLTGFTGYTLAGYFAADFGCGFTQEFTTSFPTDVENINSVNGGMDIYPNPATNQVTVTIEGKSVNGKINLIDMTGRVVATQMVNTNETVINTAALANGVYYVTYVADNAEVKLKSKLVIAK
ncbi:MAG: T9SS type A sorting domain-containing protein [Chitinophagales bacterium]|nr:T9SS type A sorting domain-containing protein [Chitinophagales bacterium]